MMRASKLWMAALVALILLGYIQQLAAQDAAPAPKSIIFYVDQKSGEVFIRPGKGRVQMTFGGATTGQLFK
jgi:hypothetical protein